MLGEHHYEVHMEWTGDQGTGTSGYKDYRRSHVLRADGKTHHIDGSSDRVFHGDRERWNPEELLVGALSQCHMLSYLHVAASHGVIVREYTDRASGTMVEDGRGGGVFSEVTLRPRIVVADSAMADLAIRLHEEAARKCFISASVAFPVRHEPETVIA